MKSYTYMFGMYVCIYECMYMYDSDMEWDYYYIKRTLNRQGEP